MTKSSHTPTGDQPQNQNNAMSNDPRDGNRTSFVTGKDGSSPADKKPDGDRQGKEEIEAFGEQGSGSPSEKSDG